MPKCKCILLHLVSQCMCVQPLVSRGNEQGWQRNSGRRHCCWGLCSICKLPTPCLVRLLDRELRTFLPRLLMEVLIHPDSTSESQEAVNMDQKEIEKNLPSVPAMHGLKKGKAGEEVGNGAAGGCGDAGLARVSCAAGGCPSAAAAAQRILRRSVAAFFAVLEKWS